MRRSTSLDDHDCPTRCLSAPREVINGDILLTRCDTRIRGPRGSGRTGRQQNCETESGGYLESGEPHGPRIPTAETRPTPQIGVWCGLSFTPESC